jgi:hypothetical protein
LIIDTPIVANAGERKGTGTPFSARDLEGAETDNLIQMAKEDEGYGVRKEVILKELVCSEVVSSSPEMLITLLPRHRNAMGPTVH